RDKSVLVLAEGAFDYLSFYQENYAVLSMAGGTFSKKQTKHILQIAKNFDKVLLTFDNDKSGGQFTVSMAKKLFSYHIPFIVSRPP
ncbi:toprim domain-containing protein, partial [Mediterraneibacter gnavus]